MSALACTCVGLGLLMVVTRAPLVVAPEATVAFYRKLLVNDARIRVLGVVFALIGAWIVLGASGASGTAAVVISGLGWLVIGVSGGLLVLAPGVYRRIAEWSFENLSDLLCPLGALGVAIGVVLIVAGLRMP